MIRVGTRWPRRVSVSLAWVAVLASLAQAQPGDKPFPAVRDIQPVGKTIWAAGDGGLILQSDDAGDTFHPAPCSLDSNMNFQALRKDGPSICLLGGQAVEGFPACGALGVLQRSDDEGETFSAIPTGPLGWVYDGTVGSDSALLAGQAIPLGAGGVYHTVDAGAHWEPIRLEGKGYLRSAAFANFRFGYLVGANRRIVSLRDFGEPEYYRAPLASTADLHAVALAGKEAGWCVGADGSVAASQPNTTAWQQKLLPIPSGMRRCSDFETIDIHKKRICIAGGLTGVLYVSNDAGSTFTAVAAPGPGPVHVVRYISRANATLPRLLAGGDAGRIWASDDDGQTWRLAHGPAKTDVLFIVAAGDTSIYPAIVAHAAAGLTTAVVYATLPTETGAGAGDFPAAPAGQWLRAAAVRAGANGVTMLHDFPSVVHQPAAQTKTAREILDAWSSKLDAPARPILLNQLAAAIRQYRPTILAVGPEAPAEKANLGVAAENQLIARLAQQAANRAADAKAMKSFTKAHLPACAVQSIYAGLPANTLYTPPWENQPDLPRGRGVVRIDGAAFPRGSATCVSLLAQEAIWLLGDPSILQRPAMVTAYRCRTASVGGELFTRDLGTNYFPPAQVSHSQKMLASGAALRVADVGSRIMTALPELLQATREKSVDSFDPSRLAADNMLLAWRRLCEQGQMVFAIQMRDEFLRVGRSHPLYRMMNVHTLATTCSAEYNAQRLRVSPDVSPMDAAVARAAKKFASWHPWADDGAGRMLLTRTILATATPSEMQNAQQRASKVLAGMVRGAYPDTWRRLAAFEADCLNQRPYPPVGRNVLSAPLVSQPGKVDGLLNEDIWKKLPPRSLLPAGATKRSPGELLPQVQAFRSPDAVVLGLTLPAQVGRVWRVTVAADADRDAWTQLQVEFDTTGHRQGYLACRLGPRTKLAYIVGNPHVVGSRLFLLQAPRLAEEDSQHTFELALPIHQFGVNPQARGMWNFQIRATAEDADGVQHFYLQPQDDPELQPERFGLLEYPPAM